MDAFAPTSFLYSFGSQLSCTKFLAKNSWNVYETGTMPNMSNSVNVLIRKAQDHDELSLRAGRNTICKHQDNS